MNIVARIQTDFSTKFGIPRQSGLVKKLKATIIFEPEYRNVEAVRGLEDFSHIWLIWEFSEAKRDNWSPTVRPPRLGGNKRVGVFATRSPFRPNPIGLSSVELDKIEIHPKFGPILHVSGADLMDGTPIFDIKPYVPYCDNHSEATGGFTDDFKREKLSVVFSESLSKIIPKEKKAALHEVLAQDPRPSYQHDDERVYGLDFSGFDVRFKVIEKELIVESVIPLRKKDK